jgi:hypothetical protein
VIFGWTSASNFTKPQIWLRRTLASAAARASPADGLREPAHGWTGGQAAGARRPLR